MALSGATVGLVAASLAFALAAVGLRLRHEAGLRSWEELVARWEPPMLAVLGGDGPPEALYEAVGDGEGPDFLSFLMTYVRRLRGEEQAMVRAMATPYLPELVPLVERGTPESRANAVLLLARLGMPRYADAVAGALDDESSTVSMIAARSLFRPEHERHFPDVLEHLPRFAHLSRSFLAGMLAAGGPAATPGLRAILADPDQDPVIRAVSGDALATLNDLEAVDVAVGLLASEPNREVHASCLRILKQLGHGGHVPLVRSMAASLDPVVRATAVSALGAIGGRSEAPLLLEKLDDPSFWVSLEAARGLLAIGDVETVRRLATSGGPWSTLARQVLSE